MAEKPTAIFTIGLLHVLLACVGIVVCTYRTVAFVAGPTLAARWLTPEQRQRQEMLDQLLRAEAPALPIYQAVATVALPWLLTLLLLLAGIGLLRARASGWHLSVGYALLSILHKLSMAAYTMLFLLPVYQSPLRALSTNQPIGRFGMPMHDVAATGEAASIVAAVGVPVLLVLYPLAVLLVMARRDVRAALLAKREVAPAAA